MEQILFIAITLVILIFVIYLAAGIVSGDWGHSGGTWLRFVLVAAIAVILIPALQTAAGWVDAGDLALMIAFIVIMFLIYLLIVPELTVADEWMAAIFASFLTVFALYALEKVVDALFHVHMFSFI
ncbi:MAG TPA: hypothetical protein VMW02_03770 [Thermoplasmata archaeon]|nr:hypothetical protein [Thermoplasmata archaeon]